MNTKAKGSAFERLVVNYYRKRGIFAMRAPASLGIDVIFYNAGILHGLECTTEQCIRKKKVKKLLAACEKWGIEPVYCIKIPGTSVFELIYNPRLRAKLRRKHG